MNAPGRQVNPNEPKCVQYTNMATAGEQLYLLVSSSMQNMDIVTFVE